MSENTQKLAPVSVYQLRRMKPWEKRVILQQLGISPRMMPKNVTDITNKLVEINEQPERKQEVRVWFDAIVRGVLPKGQEVPEDLKQTVLAAKSELALAIKEAATEELLDNANTVVKERIKAAEKEVVQHAKAEITRAASHYRPIVVQTGKKKKKIKGVFPEEFPRLVQLASQRVPIYMVGPAGCGKTFIAGKIAEALDLDFADQSCSEGISESNFVGWKLPDETGAFVYVPAPFVTIYENGGVFLFDEIDSSDANLLTFLNKAIANDFFFLPQRSENPKVVKHPDFVAVAAGNTFGAGADAQYVGRNALDAATLDRFCVGTVYMDYSEPVEEALINPDVLEWGRNIRKKIKEHNLFKIMSTRVMLDLTKMVDAYGWDRTDWDEAYFSNWSTDERRLVA